MSEYVPVLGTLLGAVAGFGGAYLLDRRRYRREDEEKLYEKVYGELYPILLEARRRYEPAGSKSKYPGRFLLKPKEVVQIEAIFGAYYRLIPISIHEAWAEALGKGPSCVGVHEDERLTFDLEKMIEEIKKQIYKRGKQKIAEKS